LFVGATAFLSAGSGVGGGGVFVPLFLLLLGFSAGEAVPLSKTCCLAGSIVNLSIFLKQKDPSSSKKSVEKPLIDFDTAYVARSALAQKGGKSPDMLSYIVAEMVNSNTAYTQLSTPINKVKLITSLPHDHFYSLVNKEQTVLMGWMPMFLGILNACSESGKIIVATPQVDTALKSLSLGQQETDGSCADYGGPLTKVEKLLGDPTVHGWTLAHRSAT